MIVVRDIFVAKPGMASKLAKMWKEQMPEAKVMTDLVGPYNTVIMESEYQDFAEWEAMMKKYMEEGPSTKKGSPTPDYTEMYTAGRREIYRIW